MKKILEYENVTKVFSMGGMLSHQRVLANDDVSFHVNEAEV